MSCDHCAKGSLLPGDPTGAISDIDGAYLAPGPDNANNRAVVVLTDAFGLPLKNSKIIADTLSQRLACDVWVPDIFNGQPLLPVEGMVELLPDRAGVHMTLWNKLKLVFKFLPRIPAFYRSRPAVVDARTIQFVNKIREQKKYDKIGAVGYCYGGSIAARIGSANVLDSIVVCHPGPLSDAQINAINIPAAWALAEEDMSISPEMRNQFEALFAAREGKDNFVEYEFVDYKGTAHGFAARPNLSIPDVKEGFEKAIEQTIAWFDKTIPGQA